MLYNCPHCGTEGVLPTSEGKCPNCKSNLDNAIHYTPNKTKEEVCSNCSKEIGKLEQAYVFKNMIVCAECDKVLRRAVNDNLSKVPESIKKSDYNFPHKDSKKVDNLPKRNDWAIKVKLLRSNMLMSFLFLLGIPFGFAIASMEPAKALLPISLFGFVLMIAAPVGFVYFFGKGAYFFLRPFDAKTLFEYFIPEALNYCPDKEHTEKMKMKAPLELILPPMQNKYSEFYNISRNICEREVQRCGGGFVECKKWKVSTLRNQASCVINLVRKPFGDINKNYTLGNLKLEAVKSESGNWYIVLPENQEIESCLQFDKAVIFPFADVEGKAGSGDIFANMLYEKLKGRHDIVDITVVQKHLEQGTARTPTMEDEIAKKLGATLIISGELTTWKNGTTFSMPVVGFTMHGRITGTPTIQWSTSYYSEAYIDAKERRIAEIAAPEVIEKAIKEDKIY